LLLNVGAPPETPIPIGTPPFVVVTSTPTPANVLTEAARARTATVVAETTGQPTPTSIYEWTATPVLIVTNTPTPATQATADYYQAVATAIALVTGTYTPTPVHLMTATATPVLIPEEELTPTPTSPPAPPTPPIPPALVGKILFRSDRAGTAGPWAMDREGDGVALLTSGWPYQVAAGREALSPDGTRLVYSGQVDGQPALLVRPVDSQEGGAVAVFEGGRVESPVWSPVANQVAFVRVTEGVGEIWVVAVDGGGLRQITQGAWGDASHPTFSPNGARLAYATAGEDGRRQIWSIGVQDPDGSGRFNLSRNGFDEWDPVWAK
jgi:Tol biopolymer transport system component